MSGPVVALALSLAMLMLAPGFAAAGADDGALSFSLLGGGAASVPMRLEISQEGAAGLAFRARFEGRSFHPPLYYVARVALERDGGAWELQLIHHKLHLRNPPPEIQHFEVSHGYNLATVNRAWRRAPLAWRIALGAVVPHTESTVRGRRRDAGYALGGPAAGVGAGFRTPLGGRAFVLAETMVTASWAAMPIAGGHARGGNVSLHAVVGIGGSVPIGARGQ